ncbi:DUF1501 domain-containing protein [Massilia sp. BJB1822]|uniref:DUF1501 domain-containing protein n=1 Tax=Massilia sp. BJB1822 TaxID=2744470 RepID=UPI001593D718|nr:DUF1501 domain-containing protein [Massilia sp. BJB1822]NVD97616.1 DUF1501 domain-containing protein [Massilia sp. BJB1822]
MPCPPFPRRDFLRAIAALAGSGAAPLALNLAAINAAAAANGDYKALVCLFLQGGNDHYNTVLACDTNSWRAYQTARDSGDNGSIALPPSEMAGGVLPIGAATRQAGRWFALHPQLGPIKALFDSYRAAIVANVGTLVTPLSKAEYLNRSAAVPPKLFSHNDQQSMWQSCQPEGARDGWGGRLGDLLAASNATASFTCISAAGNAVFASGRTLSQYQITEAGALPVERLDGMLFDNSRHPLRAIIASPQSNLLGQQHSALVRRALDAQQLMNAAMAPAGAAGVPHPPPYHSPAANAARTNPLALQLQTVARIIAGRTLLGMRRQIFFVSLGGFDTHDYQRGRHTELMARLAHGIAYFDRTIANLRGSNLQQQVTLFTASDFGRTLSSNGDGTDHGWGSHHFVIGGAVKGHDIYGAFPPVGLGHELDVGQGALLPQIAVEQYGATLASWFGVPASQLGDVFPNLRHFDTRNLGFMS